MKHIAAIFFIIINIHLTIQKAVKLHHIDVHEVINEHARIDKPRNGKPIALPYTNPLAVNAKAHAQNQQAMFNAERVRQHRAQVQRWTKAPPQVDSYMKAFRESQENHHLALEQQPTTREIIGMTTPSTKAPPRIRLSKPREVKPKVIPNPEGIVKSREAKTKINGPDIIKFTKEDAKVEKNRSHRSHGSIDTMNLSQKRYQTVYISPGTTYDQGVTIKPNGISTSFGPEDSQLYTAAGPSNTQYIYPKQYGQMQKYLSAHEIESLSKQLKKEPEQQLDELKEAHYHTTKDTDTTKHNLETPIDLYFYVKDTPSESITEQFDPAKYAPIQTFASVSIPELSKVKEYTPITEEIDDIADPNAYNEAKGFAYQPILQQNTLEQDTPHPVESTTIKSNNYYKVEVASQTISGFSPTYKGSVKLEPDNFYGNTNEEATYAAALHNAEGVHDVDTKTVTYIPVKSEDLSKKYLHNNSQYQGIHHLTAEGTDVSAYGDDEIHYASNYEFGYRVHDQHSGNLFGHEEEKSGEKTKGHYHVLLPDGRMQNVQYSAGPEGFHADISYDHMQYKH